MTYLKYSDAFLQSIALYLSFANNSKVELEQ